MAPPPLTAPERATYDRLDAKSRAAPERMTERDWARRGDPEDTLRGTPEPPMPRRTFSPEERRRWADDHARAMGRRTDPAGDVDPDTPGDGTPPDLRPGQVYGNPFRVGIRRAARDVSLHPGRNVVAAFAGGVGGATTPDAEPGSAQWWLAVAGGAGMGGRALNAPDPGIECAGQRPVAGAKAMRHCNSATSRPARRRRRGRWHTAPRLVPAKS